MHAVLKACLRYCPPVVCTHTGVRHVDLVLHLMAQPPWDARMDLSANKPFYILHYTYGNDYTLDGKFTPGARPHSTRRTAMPSAALKPGQGSKPPVQ